MSSLVIKVAALGGAVALATLLIITCKTTPDVQTEPESDVGKEMPGAPVIAMKPYHHAMSEEMQISYERADEIIMGIYTGNLEDKQNGLTYYFDDFTRFNKETLTWGPVEKVLIPILSHEIKPEIITREEFETLSDLDKVGICWDYFEQKRFFYLVEGIPSIVFLEHIMNEENHTSYRNLLDIYPVTEECNAKALFDFMVKYPEEN